MPDYIDMAQETDLFLRETEWINESERREIELPPVGRCYNCTASVPPGARFCDRDCCGDYDKRKKIHEAQYGR